MVEMGNSLYNSRKNYKTSPYNENYFTEDEMKYIEKWQKEIDHRKGRNKTPPKKKKWLMCFMH